MTRLKDLAERYRAALRRAAEAGHALPEGASLATVGPDGRPAARVILIKQADERGFVFYTNLDSRKARELRHDPRAALCAWWPQLEEQVRVEGTVEPVTDDEADRYWSTRPRGSQIGAWASHQSRPVSSGDELRESFDRFEARFEGASVPRPEFWSGYRLVPDRIEFWRGREDRLHERELFTCTPSGWTRTILSP